MNWSGLKVECINEAVEPGDIGSLTMNCRSRDNIGITNPPADCIAAVEPAAVQILRPLERQFTVFGLLAPSLFLILKENLETAAGHGCAIKMSLSACERRVSEFNFNDILDTFAGTTLPNKMSSSTCSKFSTVAAQR
jgi:hypothetical protein